MAEFIYKNTIYGRRNFTVEDGGGIVVYEGKQQLDTFGSFYEPGRGRHPLRADAASLESAARRWWKQRTGHVASFGTRPTASYLRMRISALLRLS
jgi:hypothetical protein